MLPSLSDGDGSSSLARGCGATLTLPIGGWHSPLDGQITNLKGEVLSTSDRGRRCIFLAGALVCAAPFAAELFAGLSKTLRRNSGTAMIQRSRCIVEVRQ